MAETVCAESHLASARYPHTVGVLAVEVLAHMNQSRITCLFVVEDRKPIGLIHVHDLLRVGIV